MSSLTVTRATLPRPAPLAEEDRTRGDHDHGETPQRHREADNDHDHVTHSFLSSRRSCPFLCAFITRLSRAQAPTTTWGRADAAAFRGDAEARTLIRRSEA